MTTHRRITAILAMFAMVAAAAPMAAVADACMSMPAAGHTGHDSGHDTPDSSQTSCPHAIVSASGCATVSLPASSVLAPASAMRSLVSITTDIQLLPSASTAPIFHPPRI